MQLSKIIENDLMMPIEALTTKKQTLVYKIRLKAKLLPRKFVNDSMRNSGVQKHFRSPKAVLKNLLKIA